MDNNTAQDRKPEETKRLYRSRKDRIIAGVCGGLAEYFGIDSMVMRLIFVLLFFAQGIGLLLYLILWIITPSESYYAKPAQEYAETAAGERADQKSRSMPENIYKTSWYSDRRNIIGTLLILIGLLALINYRFPIMAWLKWSLVWPVVLIIIGTIIVFGGDRKE